MRAAYDRLVIQRLIVERIEAGWTLERLETEPGFPSAPTVRKWARQDPAFANGLRWARNWRRGMKVERRAAMGAFDRAWAEDFLARVRRGQEVRELVGGPGQPTRRRLREWRRAEPEFDVAVAAAVRIWRGRQGRRAYDEAVADKIVLRRSRGATMDELHADPELPGKHILRRWRRVAPEFDGALRIARRVRWTSKRRINRRRDDAALVDAICEHIIDGGSLRSAAFVVPGCPCRSTLYAWVGKSPEFARQVRRAQMLRRDLMVDTALDWMRGLTPETVAGGRAMLGAMLRRMGQLDGGRRRQG